ncbi:unnamed protein product, partial [marine sediment metagenome]
PSPDPYYVLQTTGAQPIQVSYFHAATTKVEDLDGSKQPSVSYLERRKVYYFKKEKCPDLHTVLRVLNPRNGKYKVFYQMSTTFSDGSRKDTFAESAYSDMKYREVTFQLPTDKGVTSVTHEVEITDEGMNVLIRTGKVKYFIN